MPKLLNLENAPTEMEAENVTSATGVIEALRRGKAATAAGNAGAINVWIDLDGKLRSEAYRFHRRLVTAVHGSRKTLRVWVRHWLAEINS